MLKNIGLCFLGLLALTSSVVAQVYPSPRMNTPRSSGIMTFDVPPVFTGQTGYCQANNISPLTCALTIPLSAVPLAAPLASPTFTGAAVFSGTATFNSLATFNSPETFNSPATFGSTATFNSPTTFGATATFNAPVANTSTTTLTGAGVFNSTTSTAGVATFAVPPVLTGLTGYCKANNASPVTCAAAIPLTDITGLPPSVTAVATYDTYAQFIATGSFTVGTQYVYVRAVTGTYPPAAGLDATPLVYKVVGAATGIFGEVTVAGLIFDPIYSTSPVNAGEFRIIPDGVLTNPAQLFTGTANNTTVVAVASTTNLVAGMSVTNVNYATLGVNAVAAGTTIVSVVLNTSVTLSNAAPTGTALKFVAWRHDVTGTDNTAALQAAINYALQFKYQEVNIPAGTYKTTGVLNVGWGDALYSLRLYGTQRATTGTTGTSGTTILATAVDQPAINFQGMRAGGLSGLVIIGPNLTYAKNGQLLNNALSSNPNDWIAPTLARTGGNPGGLSILVPLAGVTVDAYSGTIPALKYPNRIFPTFTGLVAQYGAIASSNVTIKSSEIDGFGVCEATGLNSNTQGDFFRTSDMIMSACAYGIAVGNSQSHNVRISDLSISGVNTVATTTALGQQSGVFSGPFDNISGIGVYQIFDFSGSGLVGPVLLNNLYCENCVRLGNLVGLTFTSSIVVTGGILNFTDTLHGQIPKSYISNNMSTVFMNGVTIKTNSRITALTDGAGPVIQNGGYRSGIAGGASTAALQRAINFSGGLFVGQAKYNYLLNNRYTTINLQMSYFPTVGSAQGSLFHDDEYNFYSPTSGSLNRGPMTQEARTYKDLLQNRRFNMTIPKPQTIDGSVITQVSTAPTYASDVVTFGYCTVYAANANTTINSGYALTPGDILFFLATNTVFVVATVAAASAQANCVAPATENIITAVQQNNITLTPGTNTWVSNTNPTPLLTSSIMIIKTGVVLPAQLYYGSFTNVSASITGVQFGNSDGTAISTYYAVGDPMYGLLYSLGIANQWPAPVFATITSITNGSTGGMTISNTAIGTLGVPIFPYELR